MDTTTDTTHCTVEQPGQIPAPTSDAPGRIYPTWVKVGAPIATALITLGIIGGVTYLLVEE